MKKKSIKRNYIYNLSYQILTLITPLITTPYIARVLRPDGVGIVSYTNSVVTYFVLLAALGTTDYGQREIAYRQDDLRERTRMFWEVFLLRTMTSLLSLIVFFFFTVGSDERLIYLLQAVNIINVIFDITWFFQGMEEFGKTVGRNIVARILNLILIFAFVKTAADIPFYIGSIVFSTLLGHMLLWISLPQYICRISLLEIRPFRNMKGILLLFLPQIAIQVSAVMDKTMLGLITGSDFENGYYEQADRIEKICLTLVSSLGIVMIPRISYVIAKKQKELVEYYVYRAYRFVWFLALPMTIGLIAIADQFVPWFFGDGYDKTIILIRIFSLLLCVVGISSVTGVQYFVPAGKQKEYTISVLLGMLVNFTLNLLLIPHFLSIGAAVATVVGEVIVSASQLCMVRKRFSVVRVLASSKKYIIATLIMGAAVLFVKPWAGNGSIGTVILIGSGGLAYFAVLWFMKDEMMREIIGGFWKTRIRRSGQ